MAPSLPTLCVVGSINLDLTFCCPRLPRVGETVAGTHFQMGFGGKGANQAVMAARAGAKVRMVGKVGDDVFGAECRKNLQDEGIDVTHVQTVRGQPTGSAAILVDNAGNNSIVVVSGANGSLTVDDVRAARAAIEQADFVLCQLEVPEEACAEAFALARKAGVRTILNPAPAGTVSAALSRLTDLCVPNETELATLTGLPTHDISTAGIAGVELMKRGPRMVLITLGAQGTLVLADGRIDHVPAPIVAAVDTSGAGDAFIGSLAVMLAHGRTLLEAAQWACCAAALSVTRRGTQTSFPRREEVERFRSHTIPDLHE